MSDTLMATAANWRHLPPGLAADAARQDQDERWARGDRPPAETYLAALPRVAASPEDALVLIYGEVMNRAALGETANLEEYCRRFPQYADQLAAIIAVHAGLSLGPAAGPPPERPAVPVPPAVPGYVGLEFVGRGGTGVVFRAAEERTGRAVAVKVIAEDAATPEVLVRFLQEAEILRRLDHPNVVRFVAAGVVSSRPYLVSEWVGGGTLAAHIDRRPQSWDRAAGLVATLAGAVAHAHAHGVIHRDLKPGNVLLTDRGEPKVADFGVARLAGCGGTLTVTGQVLGTPSYMPPEQVEGRHREVGPAADVYGLGGILYECLTGRPPFVGRDRLDVIRAVLADPPVPPDELVPGIPPALAAACARCLAKSPGERFPTAAALAVVLGAMR